jgi:prevent-host-death family protein
MKIGIRELKARAPQVVREVRESGERVDITYRGEVVAHLSPVEDVHRVDFETAWKEFQAVARAVGKRTTKKRGRPRTTAAWRRDL